MRRRLYVLLAGALLLTACNLPTNQITATPTVDPVATEVSRLLTSMPSATLPALTATAAPTAQPTQTSAALPTATVPVPAAAPTQTPTPAAPLANLGEPTWRDSLESGKSFYLYDNGNTKVTHENGHLALTGITTESWHGWSLSFSNSPRNFYVEGVFVPQNCSGSDLYGLVFRAPDTSSGYFFGVTCDGRYNLHARNFEDGTDQRIIDLTTNAAIQSGSGTANRLGVLADGNKISLYANGTLLQEVTDTTYQEGYLGALVAASVTPSFTVWMDEIALWNLP